MNGFRAILRAFRARSLRAKSFRLIVRSDVLVAKARRLRDQADRLDAEANVETLGRRARDGPS